MPDRDRPGVVDQAGPVGAAAGRVEGERPGTAVPPAASAGPPPGRWPSPRSASPARPCPGPGVRRPGAACRTGSWSAPDRDPAAARTAHRDRPTRRRRRVARWPPRPGRPAWGCRPPPPSPGAPAGAGRRGSGPPPPARRPAAARRRPQRPRRRRCSGSRPAVRPGCIRRGARDLLVAQVAGPVCLGVGVRLGHGGRTRSDRAVDAEVPGQPGRSDVPSQRDRLRRGEFTPVGDHAEAQLGPDLAHPAQILHRTEVRPAELVHRGHAQARRLPQRPADGAPAVRVAGQPVDQAPRPMMGVPGQSPVVGVPRRRRPVPGGDRAPRWRPPRSARRPGPGRPGDPRRRGPAPPGWVAGGRARPARPNPGPGSPTRPDAGRRTRPADPAPRSGCRRRAGRARSSPDRPAPHADGHRRRRASSSRPSRSSSGAPGRCCRAPASSPT